MRITFAALSLACACMLSIGCGGGEEDTDTKKTASTATPAINSPDASSTTTEKSTGTVDPADVQLVKLVLPGMV